MSVTLSELGSLRDDIENVQIQIAGLYMALKYGETSPRPGDVLKESYERLDDLADRTRRLAERA